MLIIRRPGPDTEMASVGPHDALARANRAAGAFVRDLNRRWLSGAAVLGGLGFVVSGSLILALAPLVAVMVGTLLWKQTPSQLLVFIIGANLWLYDPAEIPYAHRWASPLQPLGNLWFHSVQKSIPFVPIPFSPAVLLVGWVLVRSVISPMPRLDKLSRLFLRVCVVAIVAIAFAEARGVLRGGDLRQSLYQVLPMVTMVGLAAAVCLNASQDLLRHVERILLLSAGVRAGLTIYVYVTVFRPAGTDFLYVSSHGDSVLWVVALALLIGRVTTTFRLENQRGRIALAGLLAAAIMVNNRRLAWVELGVVVAYAALATPPRLRRLRGRVIMGMVPLLGVYIAAGMSSPPSKVFAPVQALTSVNSEEDSSTRSREVENYNLIATIQQAGPLGMGFGHQYDEQMIGPDISKAFAQYRYLPHNSVLGLWAFGGAVGFIGVWLPVLVGMAAAARLRRHPSQHLRAAGVWFAGGIIAFSLMAWGDIGLQTGINTVLGGLAMGLGAGIWRHAPILGEATLSDDAAQALDQHPVG